MSTTLANTSASLSGKTVLTAEGSPTVTGLITFDRDPSAPFAVSSGSAYVANLDADKLDGKEASELMPVGTGAMWFAAAAPTGWLLCDGTAVSRATYSDLFAVISTTYGAGNGSTTFNLPDLRQRFPLGKAASGTGSSLAGTGGSIDHTHTYTDVVNHTHPVNITDPGHTHDQWGDNVTAGSGGDSAVRSSGGTPTTSATTGITASTSNPSGGVATGTTASNNPPYVVVNFIIKY